jgi:hypothetical protein
MSGTSTSSTKPVIFLAHFLLAQRKALITHTNHQPLSQFFLKRDSLADNENPAF